MSYIFLSCTKKKNEKKAFKWFKKSALQGWRHGKKNLAECYKNGEGVKPNIKKAIFWYSKVAKAGDYFDKYDLAHTYLYEAGIKNNYKKTIKILTKAKEPLLYFVIAECYLDWKLKKHNQKVVKAYKTAAKNGDMQAQYILGLLYEWGQGCPNKPQKALKWYKKSAQQGYAYAQFALGKHYHCINPKKLNLNKIVKYYHLAAEQGHAHAQTAIASLYGDLLPENPSKMMQYYIDATQQNFIPAQWSLAEIYEHGWQGVGKNIQKAFQLYKKIAHQFIDGFEESAILDSNLKYQCNLGDENFDYGKAIKWYKKSAKAGSLQGMIALAQLYQQGIYIEKNLKKARKLYKKAAKNENEYEGAEFYLGWLYEHGLGVEKNIDKMMYYYQKAVAKNAKKAMLHLAKIYQEGVLVEKNTIEIRKLCEQIPCSYLLNDHLGLIYEHGLGVQKNKQKAFELYKDLAREKVRYINEDFLTHYQDVKMIMNA